MGRKLLRLLQAASLVLSFTGVAAAQTTGTIIGVVTDASTGKAVAGAAVIATSANLQGEQTAVTDDSGNYRFNILPPGQYRLFVPAFTGTTPDGKTVEYKEVERTDIVVRSDKTLRANMALVPSAVTIEEQVVRTGVAPVINIGSAETGAVVTKEFLATVPVGRDFAASAIVSPGAQTDNYGISFNGASSPENNYILDGMNVTDPAFGTQGSNLLTNFVEEVNVKSGSFMPEYGRATGGVISVVTKSGSNEFHGSVFGSFAPGALQMSATPIFRNAEAIATREAQSKEYKADFGFEVGGPIMKDRLWFYGGFAPVLNHLVEERYFQKLTEDPANPGQPLKDPSTGLTAGTRVGPSSFFNVCPGNICASRPSNGANGTQYQITGKLTYLFNENNNLSFSVFSSPQSLNYLANTAQGTPNGTESALLTDANIQSTDAIGRYGGKFLDKHVIVEAQGGWHRQKLDTNTSNVGGIDQFNTSTIQWQNEHNLRDFFSANELGAAEAACTPAPGSTFNPCPVRRFFTGGLGFLQNYTLDRFSGRLSASGLFSALGHHNAKVGLDVERSNYDSTRFYSGGVYLRERTTSAFGNVFQDYRGYTVITSPFDPNLAPNAQTFTNLNVNSVSNNRGYYAQDSWSILDTVTLNAGIRWETQDMYKAGASGPANLNITDNIAPRVQAIWDFTGQGRSAVKLNWGRFYENIPLDMGDRSFGGETQINANREYCVGPSPTVGGAPASCNHLPNATFNASLGRNTNYVQTGQTAVPVAPDLKGMFVDMYGGSIEYEFLPDFSAGFTYAGTHLGRAIEDMSADDGNTYFIANPGSSKVFTDSTGTTQNPQQATYVDAVTLRQVVAPFPKPDRRYDSFAFELRKNFSKRWLASASYTYSLFRGNYPGLFRPENNQLDPNITSEYDLVSLLPNRYGPLPSDIPHQFKVFGSYIFDISTRLNVQAGAALKMHSGTPINYLGAHPLYGPSEAFILPRGSGGRTPFVSQVDLRGGVEYVMTPPYALKFTVDFFNILNQQEAVNVDQNYTFDSVQPIVNGQCKSRNGAEGKSPLTTAVADCPDLKYLRTTDNRPVTLNTNFGRPTLYGAPFSVRFGLALSF